MGVPPTFSAGRFTRRGTIRLVACLASVATAAMPALAAEFDAAIGRTVRGRCHMDSCEFFTIEVASPVAALKDGTLFALSGQTWDADYAPRDQGEYEHPPVKTGNKTTSLWLAYCSKTRPHLFVADGATWDTVAVATYTPIGAEEFAYDLYWASCHHASDADEALQKRLGYRLSETGSDTPDDPIRTPADLLGSSPIR